MLLLCVVSWDILVQVRNFRANLYIGRSIVYYYFIGAEGSSGRFGRSHTGQLVEFDYFQCSGSENNLSDCHRTVGQVCSFGDADVICSE